MSETNDGTVNGILPLVHFNSAVFGNVMVSVPYFNCGGIVDEDHDVGEQLLREAMTIAHREKIGHIELRQKEDMNNGLHVKKSKVCML